MIIDSADLHKMKYPETFEYTVFNVASKHNYCGSASIGAKNIVEAREIAQAFYKSDPDNVRDSWGWGSITETDCVSDEAGLLQNDISYWG